MRARCPKIRRARNLPDAAVENHTWATQFCENPQALAESNGQLADASALFHFKRFLNVFIPHKRNIALCCNAAVATRTRVRAIWEDGSAPRSWRAGLPNR